MTPELAQTICSAGLGLAAGVVYAVFTINQELNNREDDATVRQKRLAWIKFGNSVTASPLFAGVMTDPIVHWANRHWAAGSISWPPVAVFIGISANAVWPLAVAGVSDEVKDRVKAVFKAIFGGGK